MKKTMKKMKLFRTIQGLSQRDVAERSGVITNYRLSLLENGHASPRADELEVLASIFGTTPQLLVDEGETKSLESLVRECQVAV